MTKFRDLKIGDHFDFAGGDYPSFFDRCVKTAQRKYQSLERPENFPEGMEVGTINVRVYNTIQWPTGKLTTQSA